MPQKKLAELIGIKPNTLSAIECGRETPSLNVIIKAAQALGVTVDSLLSENIDFFNSGAFFHTDNKAQLKFIETVKNASANQKIALKDILAEYVKINKN
jgi:transcriptional regulator with XRE-family HTH domain